jgi:hypothetical protein
MTWKEAKGIFGTVVVMDNCACCPHFRVGDVLHHSRCGKTRKDIIEYDEDIIAKDCPLPDALCDVNQCGKRATAKTADRMLCAEHFVVVYPDYKVPVHDESH